MSKIENVILQPVLLAMSKLCSEEGLYYSYKGKINIHDTYVQGKREILRLMKDSRISFFSYFNSFSLGKWKKYTNIHMIGIHIEYLGCAEVELYLCTGHKVKMLQRYQLHSPKERKESYLEYPEIKEEGGLLFFSIRCRDEAFSVYTMGYATTACPQRVHLALNICTFRREEYVRRNVCRIVKYITENQLEHLIDIFVIDNGGTLKKEESWLSNVHLITNQNTGGSGGFARGMKEILACKDIYTHIINMDDDICFDPRVIYRTITFLQLQRKEYWDYILGGAMLREDLQYIQEESGGKNEHGRWIACKKGFDLRKRSMLVKNELEEEDTDYSAWWYSCIPVSVVKEIGYPLPIFIHCDDVEYGIRNQRRNIFLGGIAVWHQPFDQKRNSSIYYYDIRNRMICDAIGGLDMGRYHLLKRIVYTILMSLFMYRYKDIQLIEKAVNDYFKGPEWLLSVDQDKLHQKVCRMGYHMEENEELRKKICFFEKNAYCRKKIEDTKKKNQYERIYMLLTLNGWLLPVKDQQLHPIRIGASPSQWKRKKHVFVYDPVTQKGFKVSKSFKEFANALFRMVIICWRVFRRYEPMKVKYQMKCDELRNNQK